MSPPAAADGAGHQRGARPTTRLSWAAIALVLIAACALGGYVLRQRAENDLKSKAQTTAVFRAALLQTEIQRYRALPAVLTHDRDIVGALSDPTPARLDDLNHKLKVIAVETDLNLIYVLKMDGRGIATGGSPDVKRVFCQTPDCRTRLYFIEAVRNGSAQVVSLGRPSQLAGLYFANLAADTTGKPIGVIVAKAVFRDIEKRWRSLGNTAFVTDQNGIIVMSTRQDWIGKTITPLTPEARRRIKSVDQFGDLPLDPLRLHLTRAFRGPAELRARLDPGGPLTTSIVASAPLEIPGWRLFLFEPANAVITAATITGVTIALLTGTIILGFGIVMLRRHERRQAEMRQQILMRRQLEHEVQERTRALSSANSKLLAEIEARRKMQDDLHQMQNELVQANKLAALGQIAAGVAHEVNQPLAAIRTYAATGRKFVAHGHTADAANNFGIIGDLTEHIKRITDELRAFARRTPRQLGPVSVDDAIDGAFLLVNHRLEFESVTLRRHNIATGLMVQAERIRLEQVLVNLLQNALDALSQQADAEIDLAVSAAEGRVRITVTDNGPGLTDEAKKALFMPFSSTRPDGLGLGLVICREIATEMGGELELNPVPRGASFTITLNSTSPVKPRRETAASGIGRR